jgi:hypothetical protein
MEQYKAKGYIEFCLGANGAQYRIYDRDHYLKQEKRHMHDEAFCQEVVDHMYRHNFTKNIYDLLPGDEFLKEVQAGCITDYDGSIADVFVDGYISNLGLATDNLTQGKFLVDDDIWSEICEVFVVEVNWANK